MMFSFHAMGDHFDFFSRSHFLGCGSQQKTVSSLRICWRPFSHCHEQFLSSVCCPKNFVVSMRVADLFFSRLLWTMSMISFSSRTTGRTHHLESGRQTLGPLYQPFHPHRDSSCYTILDKEAQVASYCILIAQIQSLTTTTILGTASK